VHVRAGRRHLGGRRGAHPRERARNGLATSRRKR
jgi:hypothetical protein